jgi:dTDP-4-amino-4,6-dideoxygalactose transaminase
VSSAVYYPLLLSRQTAYQRYPVANGGSPDATTLAGQVLSIPMHPYLREDTQDYIIQTIAELTR